MYSEVLYASPMGRDCVTYTHWLVLKLKVGREVSQRYCLLLLQGALGCEKSSEVGVPDFHMMEGSFTSV